MPTKKLILEVVADIGDAKKGLAEVSQGVKGLFKGAEGAGQGIIDGTLKAFDGLKGALGPVGAAAGTVLEIASKAIDLAQFAGEREIMRRSVSDAQLAGLRAATQGLVDDQTLLAAASKGMRGDLGLTQAQMENVARAAVTLHNQGFGPIPGIVEDITEKLRTGEVEGLKNYGIQLGETGTKAEKLGRAHQAMGVLATDGNNKATNSSAELTKLMVRLKNAFDDVKEAVGQLVNAFAWLVNKSVDAFDWIDEQIGGLGRLATSAIPGVGVALTALGPPMEVHKKSTAEVVQAYENAGKSAEFFRERVLALGKQIMHIGEEFQGLVTRSPFEKLIANIKASGDAARDALDPMFGSITIANRQREAAKRAEAAWNAAWEWSERWLQAQRHYQAGLQELEAEDNRTFFGDPLGFADRVSAAAAQIARDYDEMNDLLRRSALDDFDPVAGKVKRINEASMSAARAFGQLSATGKQALGQLAAAAGTSLQAIISGNKGAAASLGEVFKQLLDQLGTEMQIQALKYLAMGTAAAFTPGMQAEATGYFTAAGIFEAAALACGLAERATGAPTSAGGGGGGGGGDAATNENTTGRDSMTQGAAGGGPITYVFKIGYGFIGDEKALARELDRITRNGALTGTTRPTTGARRG